MSRNGDHPVTDGREILLRGKPARKSHNERHTATVKAIAISAKALGLSIWPMNTGGLPVAGAGGKRYFVRLNRPGAADLTGILPDGRRIEVEVKTGEGKPNPNQLEFRAMIAQNRGVYLLVHDVYDFDQQIQLVLYPPKHPVAAASSCSLAALAQAAVDDPEHPR